MTKVSKQNRRDNEIDSRLRNNETNINSVDNEVKKLKKDYDKHIIRHMLDDIQQERFPGSGKPLYTYQDIADRYDTSASTISRIAGEHDLLRRGNKPS